MTLNAQPTYADVWSVMKENKAPIDIEGESAIQRNERIQELLSSKRFGMLEEKGDLEKVFDAMGKKSMCPKEFSTTPKSAMKSRKIKCDLDVSLRELATASKSYFENLSGVLKKFEPSEDLKIFLTQLRIDGGKQNLILKWTHHQATVLLCSKVLFISVQLSIHRMRVSRGHQKKY